MDSPGFSQAMECCVDGCLSNQGLLGGSLLGVYNTVLHHPPSENPQGLLGFCKFQPGGKKARGVLGRMAVSWEEYFRLASQKKQPK